MNFLRSLLYAVVVVVTVIPYAIVMVLLRRVLSPRQLFAIGANWCWLNLQALRWICGVRWRVTGWNNLPTDPGAHVLLLSKHQSAWETLFYPWAMPHQIAFVFKKELLKIPFFGWGIGRLDMIHIDRSAHSRAFDAVVQRGRDLLAKGIWVVMFPEGTRVPRGQEGSYKTGGTRFAIATECDVVPIAVSSAKCWPKHAFVKHPGVIDVVIGPAIPSAGREHHELLAQAQDWIEGEMRRIDPEAYDAPRGAGARVPVDVTGR